MGILKKKQQQAKQKGLIESGGPAEGIKKTYENPKGNSYTWFLRSGKRVSDVTNVREDPDGYRLKRRPNSGEVEFFYRGNSSRGFRRYLKKSRSFGKK